MTYFLMVKKAYPTGLMYLCQTSLPDPYTYKGSGKRWLNHYRAHRPHIVTWVICECESLEDLRAAGIFYSKLWNVVESDDWANLREEDGMGGGSGKVGRTWKVKDTSRMRGPKDRTSEACQISNLKASERMTLNNPMLRADVRQKTSERMKGKFLGEANPFFGKTHNESTRMKMSKPKKRVVSCIACKRAFVTITTANKHYTKCPVS